MIETLRGMIVIMGKIFNRYLMKHLKSSGRKRIKMGRINDLADKTQIYLGEPSKFFEGIRQTSLRKAVGVFVLAGLISIFFGYIVNFITMLLMPNSFGVLFPIHYGVVGLILILLGIGLFFILGGITHFFAKVWFKGTASYRDTMKVLFYSSLPWIILSFTPVGIFFIIYMIVLSTIGLSVVHGIIKGRGFFSSIISILLLVALVIAVIIYSINSYDPVISSAFTRAGLA